MEGLLHGAALHHCCFAACSPIHLLPLCPLSAIAAVGSLLGASLDEAEAWASLLPGLDPPRPWALGLGIGATLAPAICLGS